MKKNPLLAGLFNVLLPGSSYLYVDRDPRHFVRALIGGAVAIAAMVLVGNAIQHTKSFSLPQGLCVGVLLLFVLVPLFLNGQKAAHRHNAVIDNATAYNVRQGGSSEEQLTKNQEMRDKGLISEQEYDSRKDGLSSKRED